MKRFFDMRFCRSLSFFMLDFAFLILSGCGPFWVDPYITVKESQLNWVDIHYYNTKRNPIRRITVYLNGAGHVKVCKGTSDQVSNDFARKYEDENWNRMQRSCYTIDPKHANDIFQNLVNHGVLDTEKFGKRSKKTSFDRFIAVRANLSNRTYSQHENIFEVDPDLAEVLLDVVREFDSPAQVR